MLAEQLRGKKKSYVSPKIPCPGPRIRGVEGRWNCRDRHAGLLQMGLRRQGDQRNTSLTARSTAKCALRPGKPSLMGGTKRVQTCEAESTM